MSIFSLLSTVSTFGFVYPVASNNWCMYWLSLLVDNPSIYFPTAILLATVRYTGIFRHIHCMPFGCATITPNHPGFRIYLDSRLPSFLAQKFVFHSYSIQMDKSRHKGLIEDPPVQDAGCWISVQLSVRWRFPGETSNPSFNLFPFCVALSGFKYP